MTNAITCCSIAYVLFLHCNHSAPSDHTPDSLNKPVYASIEEIPVPEGYTRAIVKPASFGAWLRQLKLKKDKKVYLYNGQPKGRQSVQYAVLDVTIGNKDLQQCADAILRLRAEYFFNQGKTSSISFSGTDGTTLSFSTWLKGTRYKLQRNKLSSYQVAVPANMNERTELDKYLEFIFTYCGTYSLEKDTHPVPDQTNVQVGDVFVKAGSPGHAMIVVDVAINDKGEKLFMLAQSYMPAQDIHIVKNPLDTDEGPWYKAGDQTIFTPEWTFYSSQLRKW